MNSVPPQKTPLFISDVDKKNLFFEAVSKGCTLQLASDYAGFNYENIRRWTSFGKERMKEGKTREEDWYVQFYMEYQEVKAKRAARWLDKIEDAANSDWRAASWKLSKLCPKTYGDERGLAKKSEENSNEIKEVKGIVSKIMEEMKNK